MSDQVISRNDQLIRISYVIESTIYVLAMLLGFAVCYYILNRFNFNYKRRIILAARLIRFKISLTVADLIVLYVYAPTQIIWIITYNWYGGDFLCRTTKFINTFSLHLTANMQVLIAADRLYITTHLRQIHQKSHFATYQMIASAWMLAIACALPQLFAFHVYILPNGKPQCVSDSDEISRIYGTKMAKTYHLARVTSDSITVSDNITLAKTFDRMNDANDNVSLVNSDTLKILEHGLLRQYDASSEITNANVVNTNNKSSRRRIYRLWIPKLKFLSRQCNETLIIEEMKQRRFSAAWKNTVTLARRKTRRKAFLMLTLNMIFWMPYCFMGILSTIMEFNHAGYDFLNALVVLNAVSNLLL
ncbi:G protein-coupled receptor [Dirofilaria immitis]|nr:G protein-coupled receptor [Dirofilaria immitis]